MKKASVVIMLFYEWENTLLRTGVQRQEGSPGMGVEPHADGPGKQVCSCTVAQC